ncbi:hypothetical protein PAAG_04795 [Paracoccidioides lutzii Pb01]|uniref:DUF7707 domain-containing protein n=1 Tax=Paracoccidioides lutzii (strain ATCC MYA-826 / Pb01) TaxID=502779 RepID=C1H2G6_PARBA|nr:hypothetical protein PAAG_04795 [Paracoccidioides lutzii Pb01]EEH33746.2 hypothetical protein PAAG_04795 [Paracoccidioides lutzii Pb01]
MFVFSVLLTVSVLASLSSSQGLDPNNIPLQTRVVWCQNQMSSCPLICLQMPNATGRPIENGCDPATLTFSCVCSNGMSPNGSQYSLTLSYYICTEMNNNCVKACNSGDSSCQNKCREKNPCGAQNPTRVTSTATSGATNTSAPSATGVVDTGLGGNPGMAPKGGRNGAERGLVLEIGQVYGVGILVAVFLAGFSMVV